MSGHRVTYLPPEMVSCAREVTFYFYLDQYIYVVCYQILLE